MVKENDTVTALLSKVRSKLQIPDDEPGPDSLIEPESGFHERRVQVKDRTKRSFQATVSKAGVSAEDRLSGTLKCGSR